MRLNIDCDLVKQLTGQRTASKKHATSMNWHMSPPYGHVILVSGYPVLAAVNWPFCECPNTRCGQSVVGSGNSTFCKKRGFTKWKTPRNQDLHLYSILNTEKRKPFFNFQSPLWKLEKSAPFSHEKPDIFKIFLRYKVKQLSWVIFISHESQKSWKETFLQFFQLFAFFFKVKKSRPFSSFFIWSFWADSCQTKAGISIFSPLNWQL